MNEVEVHVNGMTCAHCEHALSEELRAVPGVTGSEVNAASGRVLLHVSGPIERAAVESAVSDAGFDVASWGQSSF
ncbi:MAG: heavy-metal-associated domain-containing protein [Leucobacter sp.]|jgi:copper chaperone CopZ|nr:heavy-metal-associated domain-containing protein [Leucobacter sp.]